MLVFFSVLYSDMDLFHRQPKKLDYFLINNNIYILISIYFRSQLFMFIIGQFGNWIRAHSLKWVKWFEMRCFILRKKNWNVGVYWMSTIEESTHMYIINEIWFFWTIFYYYNLCMVIKWKNNSCFTCFEIKVDHKVKKLNIKFFWTSLSSGEVITKLERHTFLYLVSIHIYNALHINVLLESQIKFLLKAQSLCNLTMAKGILSSLKTSAILV